MKKTRISLGATDPTEINLGSFAPSPIRSLSPTAKYTRSLSMSPAPRSLSMAPASLAPTPPRSMPSRRVYAPTSSTKKRARDTLSRFNRRFYYTTVSKTKKTKTRLASECSDVNLCLILGYEVEGELRKFFDGFVKFRFLTAVTRLHKESVNGFIQQLRYTHYDYDAYAILKSVVHIRSDNAMYEFRVGTYLNTLLKTFPCFVETYGLFKYKDDDQRMLQIADDVAVADFKTRLDPVRYSLRAACATPALFAVLVQIIPTPIYLAELTDDSNLLPILFQIYFPLGYLQDHFTHYDLHKRNVLLYEPAPNKYIEYHYHAPDGTTVRFKSNYLVKIIDYGRSFFDDGVESSASIYRELIHLNADFRDTGFTWLNPNRPKHKSKPFFTNYRANPRYDLRFFQGVKDLVHKNAHFDMCRALIPPDFPLADYKGGECNPGDICDCAAARDWLAQVLPTIPDRFQEQEKFGDMHVHTDANFEFTLA